MIHKQEHGSFYFYCACGVCGKPRALKADAVLEAHAHRAMCSTKAAA